MNTYIVAYVSKASCLLEQRAVKAETRLEAVNKFLQAKYTSLAELGFDEAKYGFQTSAYLLP
jgi:hypothetical protein